ncbi:hypothetical protein [Methylomicrobium lacus]|uniref:hypothetical protein n=1 Tax=Methylomicrobium lacus TaxID=136992 RepID=UPI0035A889A1
MSVDIQRQNLFDLVNQSYDLHSRLIKLLFSSCSTVSSYNRVSRICGRAYKRLNRRFDAYVSFRKHEDGDSTFHKIIPVPYQSDEPETTKNNVALPIKSNFSKHQDFQTYVIRTAYIHVLDQANLISKYFKEKDYSLAYSTLRMLYSYLYHLELSHREDNERASIFFSQLLLYTKECLETSRKSNRSFRLSLNQYRSKLISLFNSSVSIEAA